MLQPASEPAAARPEAFYPPTRVEAWLRYVYHRRRCFICGVYGPCRHREPEIELAKLEAIVKHPWRKP